MARVNGHAKKPAARATSRASTGAGPTSVITRKEMEQAAERFEKALEDATNALQALAAAVTPGKAQSRPAKSSAARLGGTGTTAKKSTAAGRGPSRRRLSVRSTDQLRHRGSGTRNARVIAICYDGSVDAQAAIDRAGELMGGQWATVVTVWEGLAEVLAGDRGRACC